MLQENDFFEALKELNLISYLGFNEKSGKSERVREVLLRSLSYELVQNNKSKWWLVDSIDSNFQYYVQLLNMGALKDFIESLDKNKLTVNDIFRCRSILFHNLLGKYTHAGARRYMYTRGRDITAPNDKIIQNLEKLVKIFNEKKSRKEDAFLNAVTFLLDFVKTHPFEEGVSRVSRLFANTYLYQHSIIPIKMTDERDKLYRYLTIYNLADYKGGLIGVLAFMCMTEEIAHEYYKTSANVPLKNLHAMEIRDTIFSLSNYNNSAVEDVKTIFKNGLKSRDSSLIKGALWLSWLSKNTNLELIEYALSSTEDKVKAMAILVAGDLDFEKYRERIYEVATGTMSNSKIAAVVVLNEHGLLNSNFVNNMLQNEKDEKILTIISMQLKYAQRPEEFIEISEKLTKSVYPGVKTGAYYTLTKYLPNDKVVQVLQRLWELPDETKKVVIEEASDREKTEDEITTFLSKDMLTDQLTRHILLGELTKRTRIDDKYMNALEIIIGSKSYDEVEKAYAIYLIGREKGFSYLLDRFDFKVNDKNSFLKNFAIALVHEKERKPSNYLRSEHHAVQSYGLNLNLALDLHEKNFEKLTRSNGSTYKDLEFYSALNFIYKFSEQRKPKIRNV